MLHNEGNPFAWGFREQRAYDSFYTAHEAQYSEAPDTVLPTLAADDKEENIKMAYVADFYSQEGMLYDNIKRVQGFSPNPELDLEGDGCPGPEPLPSLPQDGENSDGDADDTDASDTTDDTLTA